ncbi:hypothetical protein HAX54_003817 [Datura stramonium]|uniref:NAB domain-containing protein n=1 Tax=Datura stramonium TaxID=4076 RepID=A0ABS8T6Q0_DATST|nr:hypothetical protein [Datura stramonium]
MTALSHQDSRRMYSWWWDSHISPKNSRWLQENLTDMDAKVKGMIKLINEDADSFYSDRVVESEEILTLKKALAQVEAEKEAGLIQYQQTLEKLSHLESEVSRAREDSRGFGEQASKAEAEAQTLRDALSALGAEKEATSSIRNP